MNFIMGIFIIKCNLELIDKLRFDEDCKNGQLIDLKKHLKDEMSTNIRRQSLRMISTEKCLPR